MKPISFISEHTAEYILVPHITNLLSKQFTTIIPFYFWASREGNTMSKRTVNINDFWLISVYPRRPKISYPKDTMIKLKFNASIVHAARYSIQLGVSTFAGIPIISSIEDINKDVLCKWFRFMDNNEELISEIEYKLDLEGKVVDKSQSTLIEGPIKDDLLINTILKSSTIPSWENAIDRIRSIRKYSAIGFNGISNYSGFSIWMGGYKPFYLILKT